MVGCALIALSILERKNRDRGIVLHGEICGSNLRFFFYSRVNPQSALVEMINDQFGENCRMDESFVFRTDWTFRNICRGRWGKIIKKNCHHTCEIF